MAEITLRHLQTVRSEYTRLRPAVGHRRHAGFFNSERVKVQPAPYPITKAQTYVMQMRPAITVAPADRASAE